MKKQSSPRRQFIKQSLQGSVLIGAGLSSMGEILASCSSTKAVASAGYKTGFTQEPLPYAYTALEDVIDAKTMEIHYTKHGATYAKNLQEAATAEGIDASKGLEDVLAKVSKFTVKVRNNGGGHYNHEMFWKCMRPKQDNNKPSGALLKAIETSFTSFENFKTQFSDAGKNRFGSGWAWLYADGKTLKIGSTPNQDNPLMDVSDIKGFPLLGLDVWEHAYYLKYQNKRPDYISNWWNVVNWNYVLERFSKIA
jgi:Fe-Mn family superoxide dismutase